jgi:hypothetical protein
MEDNISQNKQEKRSKGKKEAPLAETNSPIQIGKTPFE